jgi:hypothetical protein
MITNTLIAPTTKSLPKVFYSSSFALYATSVFPRPIGRLLTTHPITITKNAKTSSLMLSIPSPTLNTGVIFSSPSRYFSQRRVMSSMLALGHKLEILKPVIVLYSIDVMNTLIGSKVSSNMLFHYPNVLKNSTITFIYSNITSYVFDWLKPIKSLLAWLKGFSSLPTSSVHTTHSATAFNTNNFFTPINLTYFHKYTIPKTISVSNTKSYL